MFLPSLFRVVLTRSFQPFVFDGRNDNRLEFDGLDNLGIYVHIPFCNSICAFCPYCKVAYDAALAVRYEEALLKEIELVCGDMTGKKAVTSLYFGGGTPALMIDSLPAIIEQLRKRFDIGGGIGVELHPDDINDQSLEKLRRAEVSMISVGIQSFNRECLKKIGRKYDEFESKLLLAKRYGFSILDVDLIFGIPGQTRETLNYDIQTAFDCGATQISTYPFIDFTLADNEFKSMSQREKGRMLAYLNELCAGPDVRRTSVWTFAKRGTGRYSSVSRDAFLGFGVSAATLLKDSFKINTFSVNEYVNCVNGGRLPTSLTCDFTLRQRAAYFLFWSAYGLQLDGQAFEKLIGKSLDEMYSIELFIARALGLLEKRGDKYHLTDRAAYIYHYLEQQYTTAYIDKMWNISRKVAFPKRITLS